MATVTLDAHLRRIPALESVILTHAEERFASHVDGEQIQSSPMTSCVAVIVSAREGLLLHHQQKVRVWLSLI